MLGCSLNNFEVAEQIGVREYSIYNWEHGTEPELRFMPKTIAFLGYVPFNCPDDTLGKLAHYKLVNVLSYEGLAGKVGFTLSSSSMADRED